MLELKNNSSVRWGHQGKKSFMWDFWTRVVTAHVHSTFIKEKMPRITQGLQIHPIKANTHLRNSPGLLLEMRVCNGVHGDGVSSCFRAGTRVKKDKVSKHHTNDFKPFTKSWQGISMFNTMSRIGTYELFLNIRGFNHGTRRGNLATEGDKFTYMTYPGPFNIFYGPANCI